VQGDAHVVEQVVHAARDGGHDDQNGKEHAPVHPAAALGRAHGRRLRAGIEAAPRKIAVLQRVVVVIARAGVIFEAHISPFLLSSEAPRGAPESCCAFFGMIQYTPKMAEIVEHFVKYSAGFAGFNGRWEG